MPYNQLPRWRKPLWWIMAIVLLLLLVVVCLFLTWCTIMVWSELGLPPIPMIGWLIPFLWGSLILDCLGKVDTWYRSRSKS